MEGDTVANIQTSWFSHDSNARNSDKLLNVRMKLGAEGYGIYFMILERLREESEYKSSCDYGMIAFDLRVSEELVKQIIEDFNLFIVEDGYFYSSSLLRRMEIKDEKAIRKSNMAKKAAEKRWNKDSNSNALEENKQSDSTEGNNEFCANAMQTQCERIAETCISKVKESKVKESKVKKSKTDKSKENTTESCNAPSAERRGRTFAFESLIVDKYGNDDCLLETFKDFDTMRKSIKKPLTERALKITLKKLDSIAGNNIGMVIDVLEQSILNSWQSVYELKGGGNYGNGGYSNRNAKTSSETKSKWDEYDFGDRDL